MTHEPASVFGGASSASGRAMWKRQVASQQSRERSVSGGDAAMARISLPSGEQIHDISKLYQKHCLKDEQRTAHRISQEKARSAREVRSTGSERQPLDPEHLLARKLTGVPDVVYNTDCGSKKTLQRHVEDGSNTCRGAFSSTKDRFASTAAYRSSTFASVVKEPYADPQAVGPGTYRAPRRAINVKKQQIPTPAYVSKAARFEEANAQVTALLALASPTSPTEREYVEMSPRGAGGCGHSSPDKVRGPVLSTTPRFKSDVFPERYVSSKQHRVLADAPDRFYDVSPSCKEASMVHNTPNFPILTSATQETVGPGAYSPTSRTTPPEDVNFIMMPQHRDRDHGGEQALEDGAHQGVQDHQAHRALGLRAAGRVHRAQAGAGPHVRVNNNETSRIECVNANGTISVAVRVPRSLMQIINPRGKLGRRGGLALPDPARVVFGACDTRREGEVAVCTCDDRVALVVEGAAEDLVRVAFEHLQTVAGLDLPEPRYLVAAGCEHLGALRVEADLGDLGLVADQDGLARTSHGVVDARRAVRGSCHELGARGVEAHVQDFVVVASQRLHILSRGDVPDLAGAVNRAADAQLAGVVELRAGDFPVVARERVDTATASDVPYLYRVIERARDDALALRVEVETHNFGGVTEQRVQFLTGLNVPELRCVVHRARADDGPLRVERQTHDLRRVSAERVRQQLVTRLGIPDFASAVIAAGDKPENATSIVSSVLPQQILNPAFVLVSGLVEGAVGQRQNVGP
ncbi:hypothetical protein ON010_g5900 [Phytophthora cinnamomi]|nr:hypothetical protein ON010_g5900 [Phytophthora cinnamomi]